MNSRERPAVKAGVATLMMTIFTHNNSERIIKSTLLAKRINLMCGM